MSEYIVELYDEYEKYVLEFECKPTNTHGFPLREEIVRCRDCKHYITKFRDEYDDTVWCGLHAGYVEPDGFCAWAVRRAQ